MVWLVIARRCGSHDTFHHFINFYYFLNNAQAYGEIPQWIPFIFHGIPGTHYYCLQDCFGVLSQALFHVGSLLPDVGVLTLFYSDVLLGEVMLLLGTWLWAKRLFPSVYARFFVVVGVLGSCVWYSQTYYNFGFYAALPLIIYLLHTFLDKGQWRYLFAAFSLWVLHSLTILAYFIPVTSFVLFIYFFCYLLFNWKEVRQGISKLPWKGGALWACLIGIIFSAALFYIIVLAKDHQVVNITPGRASDGTVSLSTFLEYDKSFRATKWIELLLRQSWLRDLTLYTGFFTIAFAFYALLACSKRKVLPLFLTLALLGCFSMSGPVAVVAYRFWPLMKYFRHIGLVSSVLRIFLCMIAGFGFEAFFAGKMTERKKSFACIAFFFFFLQLAFFLGWVNSDLELVESVRKVILDCQLRLMPADVSFQFAMAATFAFVIALFWLMVFAFRRRMATGGMMTLALLIHLLDLCGYKFVQADFRTFSLSERQYQETFFHKPAFDLNREESPWINSKDPRVKAFESVSTAHQGITYCSLNAFLFVDEVGSSYASHAWGEPIGKYLRLYGGQDMDEVTKSPPGYRDRRMVFSLRHPGALKISGVTEEKIQFFSSAYALKERITADQITDGRYAGDILFVSPLGFSSREPLALEKWTQDLSLAANQRLQLSYDISHFSSNRLELTVTVPGQRQAWMLYADSWHPQWKATVNGSPVPVLKANVAYKAIPLQAGFNIVQFSFFSPLIAFIQSLVGLLALGWIGFGLYYLLRKV